MKGQTTCPKCNHEFIMDVPDDSPVCDIICPNCNHKFAVRQVAKKECGWEEHGEPRKTILSSLKPHTGKPRISSFLLLTVCVLGIFTAVFLFTSDSVIIPYLNIDLTFLIDMAGTSSVISTITIVFSCCAFVGFLTSFYRRYFTVTAVCAFLGIFSIGFFIGTVLSIIALGLIILAKEEFENGTKGKVF